MPNDRRNVGDEGGPGQVSRLPFAPAMAALIESDYAKPTAKCRGELPPLARVARQPMERQQRHPVATEVKACKPRARASHFEPVGHAATVADAGRR